MWEDKNELSVSPNKSMLLCFPYFIQNIMCKLNV